MRPWGCPSVMNSTPNNAVYPTFGTAAATITENGYAVVPLKVGKDAKRPILDAWPTYQYQAGDERKYANAGIGILSATAPAVDMMSMTPRSRTRSAPS